MPNSPEILPFLEREPDAEWQRIEEFQNTIGRISSIKTIDVEFEPDSDEPVYEAIARFKTYDYDQKTGLYLDPVFAQKFSAGVEYFNPLMARGRHSGHGLFLGVLESKEEKFEKVAVKPFRYEDNFLGKCLKDYFNNAAVRDLGIDTLRPVGLILDHNRAYSLTQLDETLTTLDSVDWQNFYDDREENPGMVETWQRIGRLMAVFHSMGSMMHGDLAPRNIADTAEGNLLFIDWELAHISLKAPRDAEVSYGFSYTDLSTLFNAMCRPTDADFQAGIGLLYGKDVDWWEAFKELVFDEYYEYRLSLARNGKHHTSKEAEVRSELEQLAISLKQDAGIFQKALSEPKT